jgi:hypothetical protein
LKSLYDTIVATTIAKNPSCPMSMSLTLVQQGCQIADENLWDTRYTRRVVLARPWVWRGTEAYDTIANSNSARAQMTSRHITIATTHLTEPPPLLPVGRSLSSFSTAYYCLPYYYCTNATGIYPYVSKPITKWA